MCRAASARVTSGEDGASPRRELIINTLRIHTSVDSVAGQWDELAQRVRGAPFLWSGWTRAWLEAFGARGLRIFTVWRDRELVALMPMLADGPVLASPTNDQTPLYGPLAVDDAAVATLVSAVVADRPHRLDIGHLDTGDDMTAPAMAALHARGYRPVERQTLWPPFTDSRGDWDDFAKRIGKSRRNALRRTERRLRELGDLRVDVHEGTEGLDALLAEGFEVEGSGWKGAQGTAIRCSDALRSFYTGVARWSAEQGWLRLVFLRLDGKAIAFELVLRHNDIVYDLKGGYDERYRKWGPGIWLLHDLLRRAFADGTRYVEWLGTDDPYKLEWSDGTREHVRASWYGPTVRGTAAYRTLILSRNLRAAGRRLVRASLPERVLERVKAARQRGAGR